MTRPVHDTEVRSRRDIGRLRSGASHVGWRRAVVQMNQCICSVLSIRCTGIICRRIKVGNCSLGLLLWMWDDSWTSTEVRDLGTGLNAVAPILELICRETWEGLRSNH